ncbi:hypothetical protein, partial [Burkholderia multivorans]|uniref:hypothetical protein n=3 Tax=Burkholderia multivorans TaxID=87883 RepID=UPI003735CC18
ARPRAPAPGERNLALCDDLSQRRTASRPHDAAPARPRAGRAVIRPAAHLPRVFLSRRTRRRPFRRTADGRTPA